MEARANRPETESVAPKTAVFRADGGDGVGMGHLVRSAALAAELRRRGWATWLACRAIPRSFADGQRASGCGVIGLTGDEESEFAAVLRTVGGRVSWLVLDHYGLGEDWLAGAGRIAESRLVLDDLHDRRLDCDIVVNPAFAAGRALYSELAPGARLLLGAEFAPIRSEFRAARDSAPERSFGALRRILVSLGGADPSGATGRVVAEVFSSVRSAEVDVLLGAGARAAQMPADDRVHVHVDPPDVPALMLAADLAVGAGGGMAWERCAMGLPSLIVAVAENQLEQSASVAESGAARYLGPLAATPPGAIATAVAGVSDAAVRREMARLGQALVDGLGCVRIADHMEGVSLGPATSADVRWIWEIANDPAVRLASISMDSIPWESHRAWFEARLASGQPLLVVQVGSQTVGYVRFDDGPDGTEVSIALEARHRGGLGGRVLQTACIWWDAQNPGTRLLARIKTDNQASRRIFLRSGFVEEGSRQGIVTMARPGQSRADG